MCVPRRRIFSLNYERLPAQILIPSPVCSSKQPKCCRVPTERNRKDTATSNCTRCTHILHRSYRPMCVEHAHVVGQKREGAPHISPPSINTQDYIIDSSGSKVWCLRTCVCTSTKKHRILGRNENTDQWRICCLRGAVVCLPLLRLAVLLLIELSSRTARIITAITLSQAGPTVAELTACNRKRDWKDGACLQARVYTILIDRQRPLPRSSNLNPSSIGVKRRTVFVFWSFAHCPFAVFCTLSSLSRSQAVAKLTYTGTLRPILLHTANAFQRCGLAVSVRKVHNTA